MDKALFLEVQKRIDKDYQDWKKHEMSLGPEEIYEDASLINAMNIVHDMFNDDEGKAILNSLNQEEGKVVIAHKGNICVTLAYGIRYIVMLDGNDEYPQLVKEDLYTLAVHHKKLYMPDYVQF